MTELDDNDGVQGTLRKLAVPAAVSAAGAAAGLLITNQKRLKEAMPEFDVGDLGEDLKSRVGGVLGLGDSSARDGNQSGSASRRNVELDTAELEKRRRDRAKRRAQRRKQPTK